MGLPLESLLHGVLSQSDNPFERIVYRKPEQGALDKVAYRYDKDFVIGQGNHVITSQGNPVPGFGVSPTFDTSPIAAWSTSFERFAMVPPPTPQPTCPSKWVATGDDTADPRRKRRGRRAVRV